MTAPQPAGLRLAVERRSHPALLWLSSKPKLLLPVASVLLLVGGLALPPTAGVPLLVLLGLVVAWLSYLSWPAVQGRARWIRVALLAMLGLALVSRLAG